MNCTRYRLDWVVQLHCCLAWPVRVLLITELIVMRGWMKWPGQGSGDDWHNTRNCRAASRWHVSRGILRSPATFYHEYIIFHSILIQWQLILYLYSSLESRLSAPSHTNDINITIYLADSAISIITNGDHADKYWYPPISGTNESRPPPPTCGCAVLHLVQYSLAVVPSFTSLRVRADMQR